MSVPFRLRILSVPLIIVCLGAAAAWAQQEDAQVPGRGHQGPVQLELLVHPNFSPERASQVYQPLVNYLAGATGYEIRMVTARNFHRYWLEARRGMAPQLVLEDAHMAAWRMAHQGYQPLVTTADPMTFSLLTSGPYADDALGEFVGRRISSLPAPSLGYVILAEWFDNPMQQPLIESNATSWLDAVEIIFSGEAEAAMVPANLVARYPNLYPVAESREFPGLTLSASADVGEAVRAALTDALLELHDNPDHYAALHELDIEAFAAADPGEYVGLERWLGSVFGF